MSVTTYRTVARDGSAEISVEKSRFLCTVARVPDEVEARQLVEQVRRQHWNARHHCQAYVVGPERTLEQANDDGEPPGTGGPPILGVLRGRELSDVVAVVSRWFGGVLLGTGGLTRAYADATRAALEEVGTVDRMLQEVCEVAVDIADAGRLEHDLRSRGAHVLGVEYTSDALLHFAVPPLARGVAEEIIGELTAGSAQLRVIGQQWVDAQT